VRALIFAILVAFAACHGRSLPDALDMSMCARSCGSCAADEQCYSPGSWADFESFCARPCATSDDCASGERCAALFDEPTQPAVCVSESRPARCPGTPADRRWHCDFAPARCGDRATLLRPFTQTSNHVCGWEHVHCPEGCTGSADEDGGVAGARCR
jgi:hypothetical protein